MQFREEPRRPQPYKWGGIDVSHRGTGPSPGECPRDHTLLTFLSELMELKRSKSFSKQLLDLPLGRVVETGTSGRGEKGVREEWLTVPRQALLPGMPAQRRKQLTLMGHIGKVQKAASAAGSRSSFRSWRRETSSCSQIRSPSCTAHGQLCLVLSCSS